MNDTVADPVSDAPASRRNGDVSDGAATGTGNGNSYAATEENLEVLLVEAEAQYKAAEEALKGLRDTLRREKRKDEKAVADAEKKRSKMKDAMRTLEQKIQCEGCKAHHFV